MCDSERAAANGGFFLLSGVTNPPRAPSALSFPRCAGLCEAVEQWGGTVRRGGGTVGRSSEEGRREERRGETVEQGGEAAEQLGERGGETVEQ